jgi:TonB-dependent starch-binding outer membrane protein SusC
MRWQTLVGLLSVLLMLTPAPVQAQASGRISGAITDETNARPISGAQVVVAGTAVGTLTGDDGTFTLQGVPAGEHQVRVTHIGYSRGERTVRVVAGETVTANFQLRPQAVALEGIVAVGYGTQRRRDVTGSVASVGSDVLEESRAAVTFEQALQGRVAGVTVTTNSAEPGGGLSIRIRGGNSLSGDNEPLYVIDGFPMTSDGLEAGEQGQGQGGNVLSSINPDDIESIEVLKDASATAIYGSRGANGVVLITTKAGTRGAPRIRADISTGFATVGSTIPLANAHQYATFVNAGGRTGADGSPFWGSCRDALSTGERICRMTPEQLAAQVGEGTDWQRAMLQTGVTRNYQVDLTGGTDMLTYRLSGGYFDGTGAMRYTGFNRYTLRTNLQAQATDRLSLRLNLSGTRSNADRANSGNAGGATHPGIQNTGIISRAFRVQPFELADAWDRDLLDDDEFADDIITPVNELANIHRTNLTDFVLANGTAVLSLTDNLNLTSQTGVNLANNRKEFFWNQNTRIGFRENGRARLNTRSTTDWVTENFLNYVTNPGVHSINATAGVSLQRDDARESRLEATDFLVDVPLGIDLFDFAQVHERASQIRSQTTLASGFGRLNYTLMDRYLFTLTGRYDGSSKFAANEKWAFFPSGAFAWRISNEPFMAGLDAVSDLRLRLSYGRVGSQAISPYGSLARMNVEYFTWGGGSNLGIVPVSAANANLRWETTEQGNVGLDLGLLNGRVTLTADAYEKTTRDLLQSMRIPRISGFNSIPANLGSIRNAGVELALGANLLTGPFGWNSSVNFGRNRSKILDLGEGVEFLKVGSAGRSDYTHIVRPGDQMGTFYGYRVEGLLTAEDIANGYPTLGAFNQEGSLKFWNNPDDERGINIINEEDKVVLGHAEPDFTLGWHNQFSYGNFQLSAFVHAMIGQQVLNLNRLYTDYGNSSLGVPSQEYLRDHWSPDNKNAYFPRPIYWSTSGATVPITDRLVEDGSFARLQTVTLRYRLPSSIGLGLGGVELYGSVENLLTLTGYSGYDPEVNAWGRNNLTRGVDVDSYPRARTMYIGASIGN